MALRCSRTGAAQLLLVALLLASSPMASTAQAPLPPQRSTTQMDSGENVPQEHMNFIVGDILEMLPVFDAKNPTYAWVLTEGETFLQAGRARFFRVRFIRPGTYFLHAEIGGDNGKSVRRLFVMDVKPRNGDEEKQVKDDTGLVSGTPVIDAQGRMSLARDRQVVTLSPLSVEKRPLFLDLDTTEDSDGNGNAADDRDASDSFFETSATPLQLWFPNLMGPHSISVRLGDGSATVQNITIYPGAAPVGPTPEKAGPVRIETEPAGEGALRFSVAFDGGAPDVPLLLRWDFGDGQESLLSEPTHVFETTGEMTVTVHVRNLLTGQDIGNASKVVTPNAGEESSAAKSSKASVSSKPTTSTSNGGGWLWMILILLLIFGLSAGVGILVIWLLKKLRRGRPISESLASMEKTIVTKDGDKTPPPLTFTTPSVAKKETTPAPMQATVVTPQVKKEDQKPTPAPAPKADAATPSWLQKGLETAPKAPTASTPAPSPAPAPKPTPAPAPKPVTPPTPTKPDLNAKPGGSADLPPWLAAAQGAKPVESFGSTPATPKPTPATTPAPKKEETPKPVTPPPAPAPLPTPEPPKAPELPKAATPTPTPAPKAPEPPKPAPAPTPAPVPPPLPTPAVTPTPNPNPNPSPNPTPTPTPSPAPKVMDIPLMTKEEAQPTPKAPDDATPIAIIQVDSLEKKNPPQNGSPAA